MHARRFGAGYSLLFACAAPAWAAAEPAITLSPPRCDPAEVVQTITSDVIGKNVAAAHAWLASRYKGKLVDVYLPGPGGDEDVVVWLNPHPGTRVCGQPELRLNIVRKSKPSLRMGRVLDLRPSQALDLLRKGGLERDRVALMACNQPADVIPDACDAQFRVAHQWPPAGTLLDPAAGPVRLQLERVPEAFMQLAGQVDEKSTRYAISTCGAGPASRALDWTLAREQLFVVPPEVKAKAVRIEQRIARTVVDPLACTATYLISATPYFSASPSPVAEHSNGPAPSGPTAPLVVASALGGMLLIRFWPRSSVVGAIPIAAGASEVASHRGQEASPEMRVQLDVPRPLS